VGNVPGRAEDLEARSYSCGTRPDRVPMEGARRQMRGVRASVASGRTAVAHPPSEMALFRWPGDVQQPGVVTRQLPPADPRGKEKRTDKPCPARDVVKGLSRMKREFHVRFLGGPRGVSPSGYPTGKQARTPLPGVQCPGRHWANVG